MHLKCLLVIAVVALSAAQEVLDEDFFEDRWEQFKIDYNRVYATDYEESQRFRIFKDNTRTVLAHNADFALGLYPYDIVINQFGDLIASEVAAQRNHFNRTQQLIRDFGYPFGRQHHTTQQNRFQLGGLGAGLGVNGGFGAGGNAAGGFGTGGFGTGADFGAGGNVAEGFGASFGAGGNPARGFGAGGNAGGGFGAGGIGSDFGAGGNAADGFGAGFGAGGSAARGFGAGGNAGGGFGTGGFGGDFGAGGNAADGFGAGFGAGGNADGGFGADFGVGGFGGGSGAGRTKRASKTLPEEINWVERGAVSPVLDQEDCGACWAHSAAGALEAQHFIKTGELVPLAIQQLVDCARDNGNNGCDGGVMEEAFDYVKLSGGLVAAKDYPLANMQNDCGVEGKEKVATDSGYKRIPSRNEKKLMKAVATVGPIAVAIDASQSSFQMYKGGVYYEPKCAAGRMDHGVLVVGYGTDKETGLEYWLVKNSWGPGWGENGFIRMARNKMNNCCIACYGAYPIV